MRAPIFIAALALAWQPQAASAAAVTGTQPAATAAPAKDEAWEAVQASRIVDGNRLLEEHQPEQAIREAFDPVIRDYESKYPDPDIDYYSARTGAETMAYLISAAAKHDRGEQARNAVVLSSHWAYAHYGKAYALLELGRLEEAEQALGKALELAPHNPQFLSERGYLLQQRKDWAAMLESNRVAAEMTALASPDDSRDQERARALRGQGFALIELDRLDAAEAAFRESLKLDPGSQMALDELTYIDQLRNPSKQNKKQ